MMISVGEAVFDRCCNRWHKFNKLYHRITDDKISNSEFSDELGEDDPLKSLIELDQLKKEFPETYELYLESILDWYEGLASEIERDIDKCTRSTEEEFEMECMLEEIYGQIRLIIPHLYEVLKLDPENELHTPLDDNFHKTHVKFERLSPVEKLLIIHYLKIDSLRRLPYGFKPGVYFLSRLLDINPESIKKPSYKLENYTTEEKLTEPQARSLYPTLEKIKTFFDNSELYEISKVVEVRISKLKNISGKD